jgi:hypothetical protein
VRACRHDGDDDHHEYVDDNDDHHYGAAADHDDGVAAEWPGHHRSLRAGDRRP